MPQCSAINCASRLDVPSGGLSFHRLPDKKRQDIRDRWIAAIGRPEETLPKTANLCSAHFEQSCFTEPFELRDKPPGSSRERRYLKQDAVPTIFSRPKHRWIRKTTVVEFGNDGKPKFGSRRPRTIKSKSPSSSISSPLCDSEAGPTLKKTKVSSRYVATCKPAPEIKHNNGTIPRSTCVDSCKDNERATQNIHIGDTKTNGRYDSQRLNNGNSRNSESVSSSPDGKKVRSKPQLEKLLGDDFDLSNFEFRSGTFTRRSKRKLNQNSGNDQLYTRDFSSNVIPQPIRQSTKSFSKQPVTYFPATINADAKKPKTDTDARVEKDKPSQIFWEKRLQHLQATNGKDETVIEDFTLPSGFKTVGPGIDTKSLIHSLVTTLQLKGSIKGQNMSLVALEKHPEVWMNAEQPPCTPFVISENDIKKQEERVQKLRRRLAEALVDYENLKKVIIQKA